MYIRNRGVKQLLSTDLKNKIEDGSFQNVTILGTKYLVLEKDCTKIGTKSLYKTDGTVLIESGFSYIGDTTYSLKKDGMWDLERYLAVYYFEEETKNKDEAIGSADEKDGKIQCYGTDTGKTLYKGYIKVYDLEKERFVPNIKISSGDVSSAGSSLKIKEGEKSIIYDENGKILLKDIKGTEGDFESGYVYPFSTSGKYFVSIATEGKSKVYDSNLKELSVSGCLGLEEGVSWNTPVLKRSDGDNYVLVNEFGKEICKLSEDFAAGMGEQYVMIRNKKKYGLIDCAGKDVLKCEYDDISIVGSLNEEVYIQAVKEKFGKKSYAIIDSEGIAFEYTLKKEEENKTVGMGLVSVQDTKTKKYGVYNAATGKQLIDTEYTSVYGLGNHIYCLKDGEYTIYKVEYK